MAFIPGLNALFQLMNASYYARWFYMLTLMMAAATMMALENPRVDWRRSLKWTTLITLAMTLVIGLMPTLTKTDGEITDVTFGLEKYPTRFWSIRRHRAPLTCYLLALCSCNFISRGSRPFYRATPSVCTAASPSCCTLCFLHRARQDAVATTPTTTSSPTASNGGADVAIDDLRDDNCPYGRLRRPGQLRRCSGRYSHDSGVPQHRPRLAHGVLPDSIGVQRDVASRPDTELTTACAG